MVAHESLALQLLSAMAALAEFDAEVEKLFTYHNLEEGKFTVRLFDLPSQKWKEATGRAASALRTMGVAPTLCVAVSAQVTVDDRLVCTTGTSSLLSTKPSSDNEIWPLILEKAFCIHAGTPSHARRML